MSNKDIIVNLLDTVPEYKLNYILAYIQGIMADESTMTPNSETLEAMSELENGGGTVFDGSTKDLFAELMSNA